MCSIINSNATEEPIDIYRVRSIVFYNDGHWSPEYEYRGVITLFKDRIENKYENGKGIFIIAGKVEKIEDKDGRLWMVFECLNEN